MARIYDVLHKMSALLNASTATAATATYSNQCIVRGCHGVEDNYNTTLQGRDITESYVNLTSAFPAITFNMRTGPWMPTNIENGQVSSDRARSGAPLTEAIRLCYSIVYNAAIRYSAEGKCWRWCCVSEFPQGLWIATEFQARSYSGLDGCYGCHACGPA